MMKVVWLAKAAIKKRLCLAKIPNVGDIRGKGGSTLVGANEISTDFRISVRAKTR